MIPIALILFALAAVGGATLLIRGLQERELPGTLVVGHGVLAAVALGLVVVAVVGGAAVGPTGDLAILALVVLAAAALGGLVVVLLHRRKGRPPLPLAVVHGLTGAGGFLLLLLWALTG